MNRVFLGILLFVIILFFVIQNFSFFKNNFFYKFNDINKIKSNLNTINKKKYLTECELNNEKIDRTKLERERQCYYFCGEDDIVRVDTSIEFPCQPFILEER